MTRDSFKKATERFDKIENARARLYYHALQLIDSKRIIEGHILVLATWNTAAFRYALRKFDLQKYQRAIAAISKSLKPLQNRDLMGAKLYNYKAEIINSFARLKNTKGVGFTGASKILHLLNPHLFIPWDNYISGQKMRNHFKKLPVVKSGLLSSTNAARTGTGYFTFLVNCQRKFRNLVFKDSKKTHAKQIDEFNFVKVTVPLQKIQAKIEKQKKTGRR